MVDVLSAQLRSGHWPAGTRLPTHRELAAREGIALVTLHNGEIAAVDALTYPGFKVLAQPLGLELAALPVTPSGPDLDALEQLCAQRPARAIYTIHSAG